MLICIGENVDQVLITGLASAERHNSVATEIVATEWSIVISKLYRP